MTHKKQKRTRNEVRKATAWAKTRTNNSVCPSACQRHVRRIHKTNSKFSRKRRLPVSWRRPEAWPGNDLISLKVMRRTDWTEGRAEKWREKRGHKINGTGKNMSRRERMPGARRDRMSLSGNVKKTGKTNLSGHRKSMTKISKWRSGERRVKRLNASTHCRTIESKWNRNSYEPKVRSKLDQEDQVGRVRQLIVATGEGGG